MKGFRISIFMIISITLISCPSGKYVLLDPSLRESSRRNFTSPSIKEDYLALGNESMKKGNYKLAFVYFHYFALKNPENIQGMLLCAQAKSNSKEYFDAIYFYKQAAQIDSKNSKISKGIKECYQKILQQESTSLPLSSKKETKEIISVLSKFKKALVTTNWKDISNYCSFVHVLNSIGSAASNEEELIIEIKNYLGFMTSPLILVYIDFLKIIKVSSNGSLTKVELKGIEGKNKETIYLKKINDKWKIIAFLNTLFEGN